MIAEAQLSQQLAELQGSDSSAVIKSLTSMAEILIARTTSADPAVAVAVEVTVLPVSYAAILDDPRASDLLRAYAEECIVSEAKPQRTIYAAMEQGGALQCFAAYLGPSLLIGFVSVLRSIVPHDGLSIATTESLFVDPAYRHTSAFEDLFSAAEQYVTDSGSDVFSCGARIGSALDKVLSRRPGFAATHTQHTKWLNDRKERRSV